MTPLLGRQRRVHKYRIESDFVSQAVVVDSFHRETHDLHAGLRSETVDRGLVPQLGIHRPSGFPHRRNVRNARRTVSNRTAESQPR